MAENKEQIIVAIELGTSRISGIAGKKKDGNWQILAYAEEKAVGCVKRGIVYNIEKTTQCIKNVIAKLQESLQLTISQVYVGIGGQSVRAVKKHVYRDLITQSYITSEHIDTMRTESYDITVPDCELLENFPQGFKVDGTSVDDPVGVMGAKIDGDYLNVIARRKLRNNIETCFENTDVRVADYKLAAYELAENILTDQEKRAGSVLVDLGAGTTTVVVYKNNILRYLATLPIGMANITQDLMSFQVDEDEAEKLKLQYGNASLEDAEQEAEGEPQNYTTSDGRNLKLADIQHYIYARTKEILDNVENQVANSGYEMQLLGGWVLTGGGSNMKNIENAVKGLKLKIDKVRIARNISETPMSKPVIKNSNVTKLSLESGHANGVISLLMAGDENCVGEKYSGRDMFDDAKKQSEVDERLAAAAELAKKETEMQQKLERYKDEMRKKISELENLRTQVLENGKDKTLRNHADAVAVTAVEIVDDGYKEAVSVLSAKEKFGQTIRESQELIDKLNTCAGKLAQTVKDAKSENSWLGKLKRTLGDMVEEN